MVYISCPIYHYLKFVAFCKWPSWMVSYLSNGGSRHLCAAETRLESHKSHKFSPPCVGNKGQPLQRLITNFKCSSVLGGDSAIQIFSSFTCAVRLLQCISIKVQLCFDSANDQGDGSAYDQGIKYIHCSGERDPIFFHAASQEPTSPSLSGGM